MFRRMTLLLALLVLAAGCVPAAAPAHPAASGAAPQPFQLALLHTNDTWGYLLPCG